MLLRDVDNRLNINSNIIDMNIPVLHNMSSLAPTLRYVGSLADDSTV